MGAGPIVVLDDNSLDLELMQNCYEDLGSDRPLICFEIPETFFDYMDRAASGQVAMPACLLVDVNLVRGNGFDVVSRLRTEWPEVSDLTLLSGALRSGDEERAARLGARLVAKPTGLRPVVALLREVSERIAHLP